MKTSRQRITFGMICAYAGISAPFIMPRYANQIWDWRDYTAIAGLFLLLWWLLSPRRCTGLESTDAHERASEGFAFRLGQSLNRVRRGLRG